MRDDMRDDISEPTAGVAVRTWAPGVPVLLVHGSLATGSEEWAAQEPLAEAGYRLLVPDRRGYGRSPSLPGEDFERDADDLVDLLDSIGTIGDAPGAHLVGHSYGGLGALLAAARRPAATRSLALLEPPAFSLAQDDPSARALVTGLRSMWDGGGADDDLEWAVGFLGAVGTDPDTLPPGVLDEIAPLVPVLRHGHPPWDADLPLRELASASFPTLVVSGGHHPGFDAVCDALAAEIGADRLVVEGAGHEIQFTGEPINRALVDLWRRADSGSVPAS